VQCNEYWCLSLYKLLLLAVSYTPQIFNILGAIIVFYYGVHQCMMGIAFSGIPPVVLSTDRSVGRSYIIISCRLQSVFYNSQDSLPGGSILYAYGTYTGSQLYIYCLFYIYALNFDVD